jgi:hypothetical protein
MASHPCALTDPSLRRTRTRVVAAHDQAVCKQQQQRSSYGDQPGSDIEELVEIADVQGARDQATYDRTGDADQRRDEDSTRIVARHDGLGDSACDQSEQDEADDSHLLSLR